MSADANVIPFINFDPHRQARTLYWCGYPVSQIADVLDVPRTTVQSWKDRGKWDDATPLQKVEGALENRLALLIAKEEKTGSDFKEIDLLMRQMTQTARIRRYGAPDGHEGDLNPKVGNRNKGEKKAPEPGNMIGSESVAKLVDAFGKGMFGYQERWMNSTALRTRFILKSRQIGATYYFAREALVRGLETGNNQIFISASRAQANIFRQYIIEFVRQTTGIKLKGDPMVIERGEDADGQPLEPFTLYFLGTNYRTAQGYHGDVYLDETFWIYGFEEINKVASAMATQKRYHKTYFSTPSTIAHQAYPMWSGDRFNRRRAKNDRVRIDVSHAALKDGALGADGIWRHIVTIEDALFGGAGELFDLDQLKLEYSLNEFENLFLCQFIDDSSSCFPMRVLKGAMVDSWEIWKDYDAYALRPYAGEVWIGYDPQQSEEGDNAALVVVAAPKDAKSKFRVLEKMQWRGLDYQQQADEIKKLKAKYHVTEIAIDTTGIGDAVYKLVKLFHPQARKIDYSPVVKGQMVLKAQNVFRNDRIQFDAGTMQDLAAALMSIHPQTTRGGQFVTYVARRTAETGHGDLAWALLHALYCEPLENTSGEAVKRSRVARSRNDQLEIQGAGQGRINRRRRAGQATRVQLRPGRKRPRWEQIPQPYRDVA